MLDRSAVLPGTAASRWAMTTMRRLVRLPGRTPTTLVSVRLPSMVCALKRSLETCRPVERICAATLRASASSPGLPGRREG